jgi:hypothetical protein
MKVFPIVTFLLLSFSLIHTQTVNAQDGDQARSGSFYSGFGFGAPSDAFSPYTRGMGLSGVASFTNMSPSISNPAHWGLVGFSQGNVSVGMTNFDVSDQNSSTRNSLFAFDNFQVVVPLLRNQLGASVSFTPVTRSDFQSFSEGAFDPVDGFGFDPVDYASRTLGSGGINRFEFGLGFRLTDFLSVGYGVSANLLSQSQEISTFFSDNQYRNATTSRDIDGYGFGHRFGVHMHRGSLFGDDDQISLGATVNLPVTIDAERSVQTFRTINSGRQLIELNEGAPDREGVVEIPLEINAGLVYNFSRFVNVATELLIQQWESAEYSYSPAQQAYYKDRIRAGLGLQYHPYRHEQARGFFSNFKYSLGTSYDTGHLSINGEDIETLFLNAGIGIISQRASSSVDLNFHYGIRGTHTSDLVKENIWGFTLSLNLAEYMFVRSRFQ